MKKTISASLCLLITAVLLLVLLPSVPAQAVETEEAAVQTVEVGIPVEENPELFLTRSMPTHGEGKIAVFLIEFPDYPNENPDATQEYYDKLYFKGFNDTVYTSGYDSVASFYAKQSYGKLRLSGQVFDWYTAQHDRSYYDDRKAELVMEAAEFYRAQGVDFSQFDGDGDNIIDSVVFHFSGAYSGDDYYDPWYQGECSRVDGRIGDINFHTVIQIAETADSAWLLEPLGVICHELMHNLGMTDLYSKAMRGLTPTNDLMGANLFVLNPYLKMMLGWVDTVQVITGDIETVRLDLFEDSGECVIVTNEFDGFFDEFYVVAYRDDYTFSNAVIWHIDARLNEDGTAFAYQNLRYSPHNSDTDTSPYPFIEEISADSDYDYVLNKPFSAEDTAFGNNSVLGPNHMPNSDTHDGVYTGIQIHNFQEINEEYLTFDVSFVEDKSLPFITTQACDLGFGECVQILFNENIYAGSNWNDMQVTDLDGNPLCVSVQLSQYPRNEMTITFQSEGYKDGYRLVFPEGMVQDSSGNNLAAVVLTASGDRYLFPISQQQLVGTGEFVRNNGEAHFFSQEDSLVVITSLWENHVFDAKIEFMRLDYNGNVLKQTIVDNPFKNSEILYVTETGDGCFIFICCSSEQAFYYNLLFCIDQNGELKWSNAEYINTNVRFFARQGYQSLKREDGVVITELTEHKLLFVSSETGNVQETTIGPYPSEEFAWNSFYDLSNGRILFVESKSVNGKHCTLLQIINTKNHEIEAEGILEGAAEDSYHVQKACANDDGTILLNCELGLETCVFLLDAELNVVKSISLTKQNQGPDRCNWIENDGFCEVYKIDPGYSNAQYHIRRFDRYLNLVWETDVVANFIHFFKNPSGEIMVYKSMFYPVYPERECYIDYYGSEDAFKTEHVHDLVHTGEILATCRSEGRAEYWQCVDCGVFFSDEGQTVVTDLQTLVLPIGEHTEVIDAAVVPTCTEIGLTEGKHCPYCGEVQVPQQEIAATGHSFSDWAVSKEATTEAEGEETRTCTSCGLTETRSIEKLPVVDEPADKNHSAVVVVIAVVCVAGIGSAALIILKKKK